MINLDHAATAPMREVARQAVQRAFVEYEGNPSSAHALGDQAARAVVAAREEMARLLGATARGVTFTSGGTEADNQAIWTGYRAGKERGVRPHFISSEFEHEAILRPLEWMQAQDLGDVTLLHPGKKGVVSPEELEAALRPSTVLVSIMAVNNELGTIQPIADIARRVHAFHPEILVHTDAVQAVGPLAVDVAQWGVDLLSLSAHKFGGPKGVGALLSRAELEPAPLLLGGGQERGRRSGTLNVPGILGMQAALYEAVKNRENEQAHIARLNERLMGGLRALDGVHFTISHQRVPGILHLTVEDVPQDLLLAGLSRRGVCASAGSACQAGSVLPSHVAAAIDLLEVLRPKTIRLSLGHENTAEEMDAVIEAFRALIRKK